MRACDTSCDCNFGKILIYSLPVSHEAPNRARYLEPTHPGRSHIPTPDVLGATRRPPAPTVCTSSALRGRAPRSSHPERESLQTSASTRNCTVFCV